VAFRGRLFGDGVDCTPELRHAGRRLIGDTSACFCFVSLISSRRAAGVWNIPKGFPRPVGAVVNRSLVFHRFHQGLFGGGRNFPPRWRKLE
jgi:hypothetical protein